MTDDKLTFIDPDTGEHYQVKPVKPTIALAESLGYMPATAEDMDRADAIMEREA